ncbi:MAG TPA: HAMP domain-containing sensor histidine kinase [Candidatus Binatia bacterium]|jgi:signal transduction histidine kinase
MSSGNNRDRDIVALQKENARLQGELNRVNQERIEYLQNVSHQLVAPLNAIKWHIENLTAGRISVERAKKVLRSIYSQSTLAVHLTKNFALMSNLDADHALTALREPLQPVNLHQLLVNLADDFQPSGWDKGLNISVKDDTLKKAPEVLAMKPLISQAFSNIIENAVKYSDRNSDITINGSHTTAENTVTVTITNRGIPLKKDEVEKIFDRGYRTSEAKNLYPAGTGFGLYIAKRIVEIHEGKMIAYPDQMGRAVFRVVLSVRGLEGKARQREPKNSSTYRR